MTLPEGSSAREDISAVLKCAQRAADLCQQLLAYSGKGHFQIENTDIDRLVRESDDLLKLATAGRAELRYDLDSKLPRVRVDTTQVRQVIMNLVGNAADATGRKHGTITIASGTEECDPSSWPGPITNDQAKAGLYCYLEVSDDGTGMNPETQRRMFDPFFTTKFSGRGLGLATVLGIVHGHAGAFRVVSRPGQGTTVRLLFPAVKEISRAR